MFADPLLTDSTWTHCALMGPRARVLDTYGLKQEELLLQLLEQSRELAVCHSQELDVSHKLDCVVLHRKRPTLPAVGVQFTTKQSVDKQMLTLNAVGRSAIVRRLLYIEAACPVDGDLARRVIHLLKYTATQPEHTAAVFARIERDSSGQLAATVTRQTRIGANSSMNVI